MKWFTNYPTPKNDIELAEQAIDYLRKTGERPERYKTVTRLYKLISDNKLPDLVLMKILDLNINQLTYRTITKATTPVLQFLIDSSTNDQKALAIALYNDNLTKKQAKQILQLCDDSPRGFSNKRIISEKWDIALRINIGDIVSIAAEFIDNPTRIVEPVSVGKEDVYEVVDKIHSKKSELVNVKRLSDGVEIQHVPIRYIKPAKASSVAKWRKNADNPGDT